MADTPDPLYHAKRDLLVAAIRYAQAVTFDAVLLDGVWHRWGLDSSRLHRDNYRQQLEYAAVRLLQEMTATDPGQMPPG